MQLVCVAAAIMIPAAGAQNMGGYIGFVLPMITNGKAGIALKVLDSSRRRRRVGTRVRSKDARGLRRQQFTIWIYASC